MLQTDPSIQRTLARLDSLQYQALEDYFGAEEAGDKLKQEEALILVVEAQDIKFRILLNTCPVTIISKGE